MTYTIKLYGGSDDLVYAESDLPSLDGTKEFDHYNEEPGYMAASDGSVISFLYDDTGAWRVRRIAEGTAAFTLVREGDGDGDEHSDLAELVGDLDWIIWCGTAEDVATGLAVGEAATGVDAALEVIELLQERGRFDGFWRDEEPKDRADIILSIAEVIASLTPAPEQ